MLSWAGQGILPTMANIFSSGLLSAVLNNTAIMVDGTMRSPSPVSASITALHVRNNFFKFEYLESCKFINRQSGIRTNIIGFINRHQ
jgi:hypothetical protein